MNTSNDNVVEKDRKNNSTSFFESKENSREFIKEVLSPLGEVYIINEKTNEKFIKQTQRSDGTFRKNIPVRFDYMPQEENCLYQIKGKILEEQRRHILQSYLTPTTQNTEKEEKINDVVRRVPGWNPVEDKSESSLKKKKRKKKKKKNSENQEDHVEN